MEIWKVSSGKGVGKLGHPSRRVQNLGKRDFPQTVVALALSSPLSVSGQTTTTLWPERSVYMMIWERAGFIVYRGVLDWCSRLLEVKFVQRRRLVWMRVRSLASGGGLAWLAHESLEFQSCLSLRIIRSFVTDGHESRALFSHIIHYPRIIAAYRSCCPRSPRIRVIRAR